MAEPVTPAGPDQPSLPAQPSRARPQLRVLEGGRQRPPGQQGQQGQQKVQLKLPERPQLAPSVTLAGQMQGSAYVDPPWLLEREESGYVQVTELLYKIAELCDGRHTYQEIAQAVSQATGRTVSPQNVVQLVAQQLLAKGLILDAEGRALKPPAAARSLLAINGRMKLLDGKVIDAPVSALTPLFWPPVLLVFLVLAGVVEWWLFTQHGVGGGLHQALYAPALLLPLTGILALSAAFHEFGHATALRYGGGKVRGMGAGMYLIYPVLYTDVSDNYRLPRGARIRTDLGGFYFNLLFALGVMAVYAATGSEFLLLVVALINLDIIKQLLPFVRLDGYWTLVDLTGMPDFFSQMGAFLKSLVPGRRPKEAEAPHRELKWWAKAVFLLYIVVTIPFLLFAAFLMVRSAPRILATGLDSASKQLGAAGEAQAAGDVLAAAAGIGQIALLSIPMLGIVFALYRLAKGAMTLIARFSRGNALKRSVGSAVAAALATGVAMMWLPNVPGVNRPGLFYYEGAFTPIQANERLSLGDVRTGAVTERTPAEELPVNRGGTPAGARTPLAATPTSGAPAATPAATVPAGGVAPAQVATATVRAAAPAAATPTVRPAATAAPGSGAPAAVSSPTAPAAAPAQSSPTAAPQNTPVPAGGTALASPTRAIGSPTATATRAATAVAPR